MKIGANIINQLPYLLIFMYLMSCIKSVKQDAYSSAIPNVLKQNSPLDEKKIQKSNAIMLDIYNQMNFIPEMDHFLNIVNHFKKNHLFVMWIFFVIYHLRIC